MIDFFIKVTKVKSIMINYSIFNEIWLHVYTASLRSSSLTMCLFQVTLKSLSELIILFTQLFTCSTINSAIYSVIYSSVYLL